MDHGTQGPIPCSGSFDRGPYPLREESNRSDDKSGLPTGFTNSFLWALANINQLSFAGASHFSHGDSSSVEEICESQRLCPWTYLYVPMHRFARFYLSFAINRVVYPFMVLPFVLSLSPYFFTRIIDCIMAMVNSPWVSMRKAPGWTACR